MWNADTDLRGHNDSPLDYRGRRSFLLATTAKIRQIESVMHLHLKSEKSEHRQHGATEALSEGESVECRHGPARPPRQPIGSSRRLDRRRRTWSDRTRRIPGCKRAFVIRIYEVSRRFDVANRLASQPRGLLTFAGEGKTTQILKRKVGGRASSLRGRRFKSF